MQEQRKKKERDSKKPYKFNEKNTHRHQAPTHTQTHKAYTHIYVIAAVSELWWDKENNIRMLRFFPSVFTLLSEAKLE